MIGEQEKVIALLNLISADIIAHHVMMQGGLEDQRSRVSGKLVQGCSLDK